MDQAAIDHLVWAAPDLDAEIERFARWTGVRASPGGRHPSEGTRNALIRLGPASYLELIGPDPTLPSPPHPRWFGLDRLTEPRLVTWAAKATDLDRLAAAARSAGVPLGEVRRGGRELADGRMLSWRLTYPDVRVGGGLVPFLIDWGDSPHPAQTAAEGTGLVELRAEHPDPGAIVAMLRGLALALPVSAGPRPALIARLDTPRGPVELR
jgi:hypothetical protein